ncbi:MAG: hypothetical protein WC466_10720 [Candidatus Izemoplasmatales bacterium]|jgi:orotate phosphoribosyltransferase
MKSILQMDRDEILALEPSDQRARKQLTPEEIIHIAKKLNAFWQYDYEAAKQGRVGLHAELKSGLCSDGFFISRILLEQDNICEIFANQLAIKARTALCLTHTPIPDYAVGIPTGATRLGEKFARIIGAKPAEMQKVDGKIKLITKLQPGETMILVEDFITRGTGFAEAIQEIEHCQPETKIYEWIPAIINRGGLTEKHICPIGMVYPLAIANIRINDWLPEICPLCNMEPQKSPRIKPKATNENWREITTSQLPK